MPPLFEPESDYDPSDLSSGDEGEGEDVVSVELSYNSSPPPPATASTTLGQLHQGSTAPGNAEPGIVPPSLLAHLAPTTAQSVVGSLVSLKAKQVEPRTKKAQRDSDYRHSFGNALSQGLYDPTAFLAEPVSHPPALSPPSHKMALLPRRSDFFDVDHLLPLVASDNPTSPLPSFDPSLAPSVLSRRVDAAIAGAGAFASLLSPSVPLGNYVVVYEDLSPRGRKEMQERLERTEVSGDLGPVDFGSVADKVPFLQRLEPGQVVLGADMHSPARFHTSHAYHTISSLESLVSASPGTRSAALATTVIEAQSRLTDLTSLRRFPRPALSLRKSPAAEDSQLLSWLEILELVNPKGNLKGGHSHTIGVSRHNSGSGLIAVPALLASWPKTFVDSPEARQILEAFLQTTEEVNSLIGTLVPALMEIVLLPEEVQAATYGAHRKGTVVGGSIENPYTTTVQTNYSACPNARSPSASSSTLAATSSADVPLALSIGISFGTTHSDERDDPSKHTVLIPLGLLPPGSHPGTVHHLQSGSYAEYDVDDIGFFVFRGVDSHVASSHKLPPSYTVDPRYAVSRSMAVAYPYALANTPDPPLATDLECLVLRQDFAQAGPTSLPFLSLAPSSAALGGEDVRLYLLLRARVRERFLGAHSRRMTSRYSTGRLLPSDAAQFEALMREELEETVRVCTSGGRTWRQEAEAEAEALLLGLDPMREGDAAIIERVAGVGNPFANDGEPFLGQGPLDNVARRILLQQHQEIEFVAHARATHKRSVQKTGSVSHLGESYVVSRGFVPTSATIRFKKGKFCARKRGWRFDPHLPVLAPVPPLGTPAEEALYPLHLLALRHQYPPSELARLRHDYQALASLSAAPLPPLPPQPLPPVHSESPDEESPPFSLSSSGRLFIKTVPLCVRPPDSRINKSDIPSGSCSDAAPKRPAASDPTHASKKKPRLHVDGEESTAPLPLSTRLAELLLADILDAPRSNVYSAGFADSLSSLVSRGALVHDMLALPTLGAGEPAAVLLDAVAQLAPRSREAFRLGDLDKAAMRLDCALELLALSRAASIVVSVDTALTQHSGDLALAGLSPECIAAVHAHLAKGVHDAPSAFSFAALVPPPSIPTMESPPFVLVAPTGAPSHPDHPGHAPRARLLILDLLILFLAAPSAHLDASTCDALASDEAARQASCSMQLLPRLHARLYLARALHRAFGSGAVFLVPASHELVFEPRRYSRDSQRSASHGERFAANEAGSWALAFDAVAARSEVDAALASLVEAHCEAGAPGGFSALLRMPCGGEDGSHVWPLWQPEKLGAVAMDAPGGQKKLLKKAKAKKTSAVPTRKTKMHAATSLSGNGWATNRDDSIAFDHDSHLSVPLRALTESYPSVVRLSCLNVAADDPFVTPRTSDEGPPARLNLDLEQVEADKKKRVKQIRAIDAARGVGPENAALWLNVFLLACCVDVGVVEQESDWFGGDQAATALFQQIVKQIHSFPDKYSFARDHSPARLLWQKELLDPDVPPWRKVALVSTIRGTLIGSSPSTYSHFSTPPANIWDLETTLRSDPVRPLLTTTDAHGSLGSINAYGAPTDISPSHVAHFWHGAPHFARVAGLPATQQAPRPSFSSVLSIFRHLWIAPSGAPVLAHNGEAPGPAPVDRSGVPLAAIAKTAADVRRLRKEAPVPVWTPEQPVPDSFEGFTIYPKDLVGHETHEVGNFAAFPQIRGGLTSTLTVSDLASIDVVAMPTKQDFADLIFSIARGGFRGIVQLGFVDAYGEDAFERFIEVMRSRWSEGGLHSDVKKVLAYHGIFMDLLHLEHLSCKIGRPDFDKFKKDAVFAKLLNLAPRLLNLDGPLWRAVQQRAAAARQ